MTENNKKSQGFIPKHGGYRNLLSREVLKTPHVIAGLTRNLFIKSLVCSGLRVKPAMTALLEKDFLKNGGLRENMTKARIENRNKKN